MMNASTPLLFLLVSTFATIGSCSSESTERGNRTKIVSPEVQQGNNVAKGRDENTAGTDSAPQRIETENDRYWLEEAATACKNSEFKSFFVAFVRSAAVRDLYTADPITLSTNGKVKRSPRTGYFDFPIGMTDHAFISRNSGATEKEQSYVRLSFDQSQGDKYRIDWVRVRYAGIGNDADGEAEIIGTHGLPGYLIFEPTPTCWQLVEDSIYDGPYEGDLGIN